MKLCTHFERMKDLWLPNDCRLQVYYLVKFRYWRYIIFKVDEIDKSSISIEKCGLRSETVEHISAVLHPTSPRYILLDHEFTESGHGVSRKQDKIIFISFIPDDTKEIQQKNLLLFKKSNFKKMITSKTGLSANFMDVTIRDLSKFNNSILK